MKNKVLSLLILCVVNVMLTGCGGGGGTSSTSYDYDFYDYIVSKNSITKNWDAYTVDSTNTVQSTSINNSSSTENIISPTKAIVTEDTTITYEALSNSIYVIEQSGSGNINRYISLNEDIIDDYKFVEYFSTYKPLANYDYSFNDVIKIQVDFSDGTYTYDYYSKGLGKVVTTSNYSVGSANYVIYSIVNNY